MFDRDLAADSPMRTALFAEMSNTFPLVDWARVLDIKLLQRIAITFGIAILILGTWALAKPRHFDNSLARILLPASNIPPITRTRIDRVEPGDTQVSRGHKLDVTANLGGNVPAAVWLYFREAGGGWQHELMGREVGATTFTHAWDDVRQPTEYYVAAGDSHSPTYHVTVRAKTAVSTRIVEIQPPAYTRLPKNIVKDWASLPNLLPGSRVTASLDFNAPLEDIQIRDLKDLMAAAVEKMLTDAEIFPDIPNANELRSILAEIFQDIQQSDLDEIANNKQKLQEIAEQKEDAMLKGFEEAQKKTEEMEEWLPTSPEHQKWLLENFDKTQFPDMPQTPLPEAFTDLVGNLLKTQKDIQDQIQDSASNQFLPSGPVGGPVADGQQGTLGGRGKSSNEALNHNEQSGRSSGGREGMSNGDTAQTLEGDKADVRRTNDGFQAGHVKDDGLTGETRATGGGKSGGFSDRQGMEGNGPVRAVNAQERAAASAAAVQQALLADKTSKTYAEASMLYLKADGLPEVARLMKESQSALQDGRVRDFKSINRKITAQLTELKSGINTQKGVVTMKTGEASRAADAQMISGNEGEAPSQYKDAVADYYRSLLEAK